MSEGLKAALQAVAASALGVLMISFVAYQCDSDNKRFLETYHREEQENLRKWRSGPCREGVFYPGDNFMCPRDDQRPEIHVAEDTTRVVCRCGKEGM